MGVKVGDEIAFRTNYGRDVVIEKVEKVSPTGRISCTSWTLNPDLTVRGRISGFDRVYRGEIVTNELREMALRRILLDTLAASSKKLGPWRWPYA